MRRKIKKRRGIEKRSKERGRRSRKKLIKIHIEKPDI